MSDLTTDFRFALRRLLRSPGFTAVTVLTLALGIGASTAVFSLVDGVLLSPLPYPESERLVHIGHQAREGADDLPMSPGLYLLYAERSRAIESIALSAPAEMNLAVEGQEPVRVDMAYVTRSFFEVLGVGPARGRGFSEEEDRAGAELVVVLSHALWERQYGADPEIVGKTIVLDGGAATVIGVMPEGFGFRDTAAQLYLPFRLDPSQAPLAAFGADGIARLAPGATMAGLDAELSDFVARLAELYPQDQGAAFLANLGLGVNVQPLKATLVGDVGRTLWIILGTVGFVLLIACANVANLFLVRAEGQQRETAVRVALGAGRAEVLRPLFSETALLALAGGAAGVAIAAGAVRLIVRLAPTTIPRLAEVGIDVRVLAFTALATGFSALLFGVLPVMRHGSVDLSGQLKEGGDRGGTVGKVRNRARNALVVAQVALALLLMVGSGLMLRSSLALLAVEPGFDPEGVLTVRIAVPPGEIASPVETAALFRTLIGQIEQQPGVLSASAVASPPLGIGVPFLTQDLEDHPVAPGEVPVIANVNAVAAGYFETMGMRLVEGRGIESGDGADGVRAVVVSESLARKHWPGQSALGRRIRQGPFEAYYDIVGVAADAHYQGLDRPAEEMVYYPTVRGPTENPFTMRQLTLVIRVAAGDPMDLLPVVRRELAALNARIPLALPRTMEDAIDASTARVSFSVVMLAIAAGIALLLGLVGIYGVISYLVTQRTREIGVRMALGASAATVRGMVVRQGLVLGAAGIAVGLAAAFALSRVMAPLLFGVEGNDLLTYGTVSLALGAAATLASWLPAHRASGLDPAIALRKD